MLSDDAPPILGGFYRPPMRKIHRPWGDDAVPVLLDPNFLCASVSVRLSSASISLRLKRTSNILASPCPTMRSINPQAIFRTGARGRFDRTACRHQLFRKQPALFNDHETESAIIRCKTSRSFETAILISFRQTVRPYIGERHCTICALLKKANGG